VAGDLDAGAAGCQKFLQLSVVDNIDRPVAFRYPFNKMCTTFNYQWSALVYEYMVEECTELQGLCGHSVNTLPVACLCKQKNAKIPRLWLVHSFLATAVLTTSPPKQHRAWCLRFAVDNLSFKFWYQ
jgi:hypothetical protein